MSSWRIVFSRQAQKDAKKLAAYLGERARGGAGLIVTGGFSPDRSGRLTPRGSQADARTLHAHELITREVHEADGRIVLQLLHAGRYAFHPLSASPSGGKSPLSPFRSRRLTRSGVQRTIDHFAEAARRAVDAGYEELIHTHVDAPAAVGDGVVKLPAWGYAVLA